MRFFVSFLDTVNQIKMEEIICDNVISPDSGYCCLYNFKSKKEPCLRETHYYGNNSKSQQKHNVEIQVSKSNFVKIGSVCQAGAQ